MLRSRHSRHVKTVKHLRKIANLSIEELAAATRISTKRLASFEVHRARLSDPEIARVLQTLFRSVAARLGVFDHVSNAAADNADKLMRLLEQTADLDVAALVPLDLPTF